MSLGRLEEEGKEEADRNDLIAPMRLRSSYEDDEKEEE